MRFLLYAIGILFLLRLFFSVARAIFGSNADRGEAPRGVGGSDPGSARKGGKSRVKGPTASERSNAIEVPFTEIPPEEPARRP